MTDLAYLGVADAARLLREKKLSPVEYAQALIARIDRHDPQLNAFLRFTPEIAIEDVRRGRDEGDLRSRQPVRWVNRACPGAHSVIRNVVPCPVPT